MRKYALVCLSVVYFSLQLRYVRTQSFGQAELVFEWKWLDIDWPSEADKQNALSNGTFIPQRNLLSGVKVYKGEIYISIPRRKWTNGHPISLAKVVILDGQSKLRPYPNWAAQTQGNCDSLQFVQSVEIDPNTGLMYVIDTGRVGLSLNLCPAKIVIFDLNTDKQVGLHVFPEDVVNRTSNFLNDIVLDYVDGVVRYAYITDTNDASIAVYDFQGNSAHKFQHPSMRTEDDNATVITINGKNYNFPIALNGIAMSPDFKYVYYCALGAYDLYQVPTSTLRNALPTSNTGVRFVGRKVSQTDGIVHGKELLYYTAIGLNAIYYWNTTQDTIDMKEDINLITMETQKELVRNDSKMQWPSNVALDNEGWLWIACNRLQVFWNTDNPPDDGEAYMRIWKVYVNETGYLFQADTRTQERNSGRTLLSLTANTLSGLFISTLMSFTVIGFSRFVVTCA